MYFTVFGLWSLGTRLSGSQCRLLYDISINTATYLLPLMSIISFLLCTRLDVLIVIVCFFSEDNTDAVVQQLLHKFSIKNNLKCFALFEQTLEQECEGKIQSLLIQCEVPTYCPLSPLKKGGQLKVRTSKSKDSSINVVEQKLV